MKRMTLNSRMENLEIKCLVKNILSCLIITVSTLIFAGNCLGKNEYSPIVEELHVLYEKDPGILNKALANAVTPPTGVCSRSPVTGEPFCWKGKLVDDMLIFFESWLNFTPTPQNDGFAYYQLFYDFCYNNLYAIQFVETEPWLSWTKKFTKARGKKMDAPVDPKIIDQ